MNKSRREEAYQVRLEAAAFARGRGHPVHKTNGDEQRYAGANYAMSFTKGLEHDGETGLIKNREDFEHFRRAIDRGFIDAFTASVPVSGEKDRPWEAPTAGIVFDLEGPDAEGVTMPPAPTLVDYEAPSQKADECRPSGEKSACCKSVRRKTDELAYEMAEVYELALLRDVPLTSFSGQVSDSGVAAAVERMNSLPYDPNGSSGRPRTTDENGRITSQNIFRGSSPKVDVGPYLSQLLLIGNDQPCSPGGAADGFIQYGALRIDQRVPVAKKQDYLTDWETWLSVQNGRNLRDNDELFEPPDENGKCRRRFITFPRDLATYVHDDALYEAYLNACLILLSMGAPFDPAFSSLSGQGTFYTRCKAGLPRQAGGFALYGGPHVLTLVTEVATRALKAVRYQKFNTHLRLRPEALAARIERAGAIECRFPQTKGLFSVFARNVGQVVGKVIGKYGTALLPMAFQEGSPMHPSYGAGHATVAGACVTMLKAFFDTGAVLVLRGGKKPPKQNLLFAPREPGDCPVHYVPGPAGTALVQKTDAPFLTLEGELNKLAANISIGRNMAGVHYYSDYYDSLRLGERIALGILEEQALCYPTDPFVLTVPTFDGDVVRIGAR